MHKNKQDSNFAKHDGANNMMEQMSLTYIII